VILLDANLLIYAWDQGSAQHEAARTWLDRQLNELARVGLPWPSLLTFVRLVSNPRVFERPQTVAAAWAQVERWLDVPAAWIPAPTARHREVLGHLLVAAAPRANLVPDAHLAALAVEHGLVLCSSDRDFARFPGLKWENPLSGR
jgi:toxin-antitoxin system PIN domain toxin